MDQHTKKKELAEKALERQQQTRRQQQERNVDISMRRLGNRDPLGPVRANRMSFEQEDDEEEDEEEEEEYDEDDFVDGEVGQKRHRVSSLNDTRLVNLFLRTNQEEKTFMNGSIVSLGNCVDSLGESVHSAIDRLDITSKRIEAQVKLLVERTDNIAAMAAENTAINQHLMRQQMQLMQNMNFVLSRLNNQVTMEPQQPSSLPNNNQ